MFPQALCRLHQAIGIAETRIGLLLPSALFALFVYIFTSRLTRRSVKAPVVGHRSVLEPGWLVGYRFTIEGRNMLRQGYQKFRDKIFKVRCNGLEVVLLPHRYIDELHNVPEEKASPPQALFNKGLGHYVHMNIILESRLHVQIVQQRLTPNLVSIMPQLQQELDFALEEELPHCRTDEWVSVNVQDLMARLVGRLSARVLAGRELCRNEEWLSASVHHSGHAFATSMTLRMVPGWMRPIVAPLIPFYWQARSDLATAKRLVGALVERRRVAEAQQGDAYVKPNDLLQWMMDEAGGDNGTPHKLAHRLLFVSDASVLTTGILTTHFLLDLCAHPQYLNPLLAEITDVMREGGNFQKTMVHKMVRLDSFLKECQRMNPTFLMTFDRVLKAPMTLSDGTRLPKNTHIAVPTDAMLHDPAYLPGGGDPNSFDPFRYARLREQPENAHRYQLATTDSTSLAFGHGKHACPGRFFASSEAKLLLCNLLLRYEIRLPDGQTRPRNLLVAENLVPDPSARLLFRKRDDDEIPRDLRNLGA
ncbi:cytochrome P450 [Aspergillus ibericus CBS 121593]|uniref:Cytochrome P450 n=1 Tax=Aspergillus ibericus CBS 121593 TaxID=1448316 RepID=A0A395H8R5_9EURO|nr:cytochrome P450 [Aspergillus ibericus CBS 121593]RAL02624.1 cytochrome P450 [Aspergillus ibericus CBS 121593]